MRQRQAGVTLIEVLIAVTLLSLLSLAMLFALRVGFSAYSKTNDKLMANRKVAGAQRILEDELEGLIPMMPPCTGLGQGPNALTFVLFQGEPQMMRLVSAYSLQQAWRGQPQLLELFVIPGDEGRGVRLVVNETPYTRLVGGRTCTGLGAGGATVLFSPAVAGPKSFVLADQLAYCRFSYLVPPQVPDPAHPTWSWSPTGTGRGWPKAIRIEMAPFEPDPSRIQPITVTAPIYIHRSPLITYVDKMPN